MPLATTTHDFLTMLTQYYHDFGRHDMLWRQPDPNGSFDPYKIAVSEIMLQQTQVDRVAPKYVEFLKKFPDVHSLAQAPLGEVLAAWSGLGYNRRAKYLWQAAQVIESEYAGVFPASHAELIRLPGIGPNTAGAILAYAHNQPVVFVETNIRTVIIHHFYTDTVDVSDALIRETLSMLVAESNNLEQSNIEPREFYWALMDYGSHLKKTIGNISRSSKHYTKQSKFHGSRRQIRGRIILLLTEHPAAIHSLRKIIQDERFDEVAAELVSEGLIVKESRTFRLA